MVFFLQQMCLDQSKTKSLGAFIKQKYFTAFSRKLFVSKTSFSVSPASRQGFEMFYGIVIFHIKLKPIVLENLF